MQLTTWRRPQGPKPLAQALSLTPADCLSPPVSNNCLAIHLDVWLSPVGLVLILLQRKVQARPAYPP